MEYEDMLKKVMEKLPKKTDGSGRFKLPPAACEVSGSKTIFKNFGEILSVLRRDQRHFSKYLFKELATPGNIQGQTLIFQGRIQLAMLNKKIGDYVKEFVYCKECGEPDTKLAKEDRITFMKCEACGSKRSARSI
jgi:translation initiation factor 2 subunit 2